MLVYLLLRHHNPTGKTNKPWYLINLVLRVNCELISMHTQRKYTLEVIIFRLNADTLSYKKVCVIIAHDHCMEENSK